MSGKKRYKVSKSVEKFQKGGSKEQYYTYANSKNKYKKVGNKWYISNEGTDFKFVPIQDPTGSRTKELNKNAKLDPNPWVQNPNSIEGKINKAMGDVQGQAARAADWYTPKDQDQRDNLRHSDAARRTQQAIANATGSDLLGYYGSIALGTAHELGTMFSDDRPWNVVVKEGLEDFYTNRKGAEMGYFHTPNATKRLSYLSNTFQMPDGYGAVKPFPGSDWTDPYDQIQRQKAQQEVWNNPNPKPVGITEKFQNAGMKTTKSKEGTITNKFINKKGQTVVQVKTKDGRYYEKVLEPQINPLDNTPKYQNQLSNKSLPSETTQAVAQNYMMAKDLNEIAQRTQFASQRKEQAAQIMAAKEMSAGQPYDINRAREIVNQTAFDLEGYLQNNPISIPGQDEIKAAPEYSTFDKIANIVRNPLVAASYAMQPGAFNMPMNYSEFERSPNYQDDVWDRNKVAQGLNFASYFTPLGLIAHGIDNAMYTGTDVKKAINSGELSDWKQAGMSALNTGLDLLAGSKFIGGSGRLLNTGENATLKAMQASNKLNLPASVNTTLGTRLYPKFASSTIKSADDLALSKIFPQINPNSVKYNPFARNAYNNAVGIGNAQNVVEAVAPIVDFSKVEKPSEWLSRYQLANQLKNEGLIPTNIASTAFGRSKDVTGLVTKEALERANTVYRATTPDISKVGAKDIMAMLDKGVDLSDEIAVAEYMNTHVPYKSYGDRANPISPGYGQDLLYTGNYENLEEAAKGLGHYGTHISELRPNLDFTTGTPQEWFQKYYQERPFIFTGKGGKNEGLGSRELGWKEGAIASFPGDKKYYPFVGNKGSQLLNAISTTPINKINYTKGYEEGGEFIIKAFQKGGIQTVKSKEGTITNKFINKKGQTVVQVKTKDGRYYEKVLEPQINPLDTTPRYQNALLNNPAIVADNTRVIQDNGLPKDIQEVRRRQEAAQRAFEESRRDEIKQGQEYGIGAKTWDVITNPFTAAEYIISGGGLQNMPRNINEMRIAGIDPGVVQGRNLVGNTVNAFTNLVDAGDKVIRNVGEGNYLDAGLEAMRFIPSARLSTGLGKKVINNTPNISRFLPTYKNVYRVEPTSYTKDVADNLSGRWFGELSEMPFYIKHSKDPEAGIRMIRAKVPTKTWESISGYNMPINARLMSGGTGNYKTFMDAANAGEIPIGAARRLQKGVPIPSDLIELSSNPRLINLSEGILPELKANKYRVAKPKKFSPFDRVEFPSGDLGKEGAFDYIFNVSKDVEKPIFGIPRKYFPFQEGGIQKGEVKSLSRAEIKALRDKGYNVKYL